ncbi:hypothetical protein OS189_01355 [Sulfitobacter sp. F26169L]|uniref:hypothetical protein n=1 Tax=Sulfitobacter sp. F26169L TaxID=2996015 RepID=UPI002260B418|nr:hypothetical protein [Sulfitobacter sp. F26169L]MCX7564988.1 hypothetical protein [Sulfitobacter sp. F26169L]
MPDASNHTIKNFSSVFPTYLDALTGLLIELRRAFDGDLDKALIMAVVGERHFANRVSVDTPTLDTLGATPVTDGPSINVLSVAQYTDIPRETVRRKVAALIKRGWISCDAQGNLSPTAAAASDLQNRTDATVKFIDRIARASRG